MAPPLPIQRAYKTSYKLFDLGEYNGLVRIRDVSAVTPIEYAASAWFYVYAGANKFTVRRNKREVLETLRKELIAAIEGEDNGIQS